MRTPNLASLILVAGLVSACETTDQAGDEGEFVQPGEALPDAPDSIVRLQVEDYQQFLNQTIREYRFCVRSASLELDDGTSDPDIVVERAQRRCEHDYRTAHRTANLLGDLDQIETLREESRAAALESLIASRS